MFGGVFFEYLKAVIWGGSPTCPATHLKAHRTAASLQKKGVIILDVPTSKA
jgi:hypothetical protein